MSAAVNRQSGFGLEIWVQPGIPEDNELVFNVHFRNAEGTEWEVSGRLMKHCALIYSYFRCICSARTHILVMFAYNIFFPFAVRLLFFLTPGFISSFSVWKFGCRNQ